MVKLPAGHCQLRTKCEQVATFFGFPARATDRLTSGAGSLAANNAKLLSA